MLARILPLSWFTKKQEEKKAQIEPFTAFVSWPSAPLTDRLVRHALGSLQPSPEIITALPEDKAQQPKRLLQWSTYDSLDHDLALFRGETKVLSSAYTIRKALIRKHFLSRCTHHHVVKNPESVLKDALPKTWEIELRFVDELDEMWADELYDLGAELDKDEKWFILKPGMADRGMGIRLFKSKEELETIFLEFEDPASEEEEETEMSRSETAVATSQLRHFVVQEYLDSPLLLDPSEILIEENGAKPELQDLRGHKFHIRAYCVASGALSVYLYDRTLALFSAVPYTPPTSPLENDDAEITDLAAHLTNTSLQAERGELGVRLLDELTGAHILAPLSNIERDLAHSLRLSAEDIADIKQQMTEILGDTFRAALGMSVHFQPLPNAFELYGVDFLVTHSPNPTDKRRLQVSLLEVNSEPAIELTGPRLTWILEELFVQIGSTCVLPFFAEEKATQGAGEWVVGETRGNLRKCLDVEVRGEGGWRS